MYLYYIMELDWCSQENISNFELFNEKSLIAHKMTDKTYTKQTNAIKDFNSNKIIKELNVNECFNLNLDTTDKTQILEILNYLSYVSNNLRTIIRNKNLISGFDQTNFNDLIKYLVWLKNACDKIKNHFNCNKKKENSNDIIFKPFKTSSYKFCNYKNYCSIHKNKNKFCDKNHFVFEMALNDIDKLIESLNLITANNLDYLNWIFFNNSIKITISENSNVVIEKIENNENVQEDISNVYFINKNVIFKCFDVISYVLNKMFEEASTFLTYDIDSLQINL
jgi:hypothetical protein